MESGASQAAPAPASGITDHVERQKKIQAMETRYRAKLHRFARLLQVSGPGCVRQALCEGGDVSRRIVAGLTAGFVDNPKLLPSTKLQYLSALGVVLKTWAKPETLAQFEPELREIDSLMRRFKHETVMREKRNLLDSQAEQRRWMSWPRILEIYRHVERLCTDPDSLFFKSYHMWQKYLILALYTEWEPIRLDYGTVRVFRSWESFQLIYPDQTNETNYIVEDMFYLNRDKVAWKHGPAARMLPAAVLTIMKSMDQLFGPRDYLLTSNKNRLAPMVALGDSRKSGLVWALKAIPQAGRFADPSGLCVDTIRSAYATQFMCDPCLSMLEREQRASRMRTSLRQLEQSYVKVRETSEALANRPGVLDAPVVLLDSDEERTESEAESESAPEPRDDPIEEMPALQLTLLPGIKARNALYPPRIEPK